MKISLHLPASRVDVKHEPNARHVEAPVACPVCAAPAPLRVIGGPRRIADRDHYEADAYCQACGIQIGKLRVEMETLFGLEEDESVLTHGRARVYG